MNTDLSYNIKLSIDNLKTNNHVSGHNNDSATSDKFNLINLDNNIINKLSTSNDSESNNEIKSTSPRILLTS